MNILLLVFGLPLSTVKAKRETRQFVSVAPRLITQRKSYPNYHNSVALQRLFALARAVVTALCAVPNVLLRRLHDASPAFAALRRGKQGA